ncbi:BAI1-associated protein 3-like isoform X2 [Centruroides vittatus]|uniref:BAI1-associated protein 3-like isoform X2 n=1 Tax=Centruroides vittatus TaxID=120091 RepID=UPI00350F30DC
MIEKLVPGGTKDVTIRESFSNHWVQESDGNFFESFTALSWKQENRRLQVAREIESLKDEALPKESEVGVSFVPYKIGKKEKDELYVEVLYTIKHKIGANGGDYSVYAEDLYDYAQKAFCVSQETHKRLFAIAQEEQPPILVLNLIVVEAQGLEAKDPNGYSDPYCMLGIQPGSGTEDGRRYSWEDEVAEKSKGSPRRLRKFGASLKRRERNRSNSLSDTLPAKFIRTTTVKPQTLCPKWNETFRLDIEDIRSDRLHLDIWDHDDESSVFDAARKLNEISGLKGLGRYFKQIAQSARTSAGESIDDFLGCVNIPLEDIPSCGLAKWFPLEGRSHRSSVQGQIYLKLNLGTREDRGSAVDEDNWKEVVEHQELLWMFIEYELSQHQGPSSEWAGDLSQAALTILHQHAIQGDLTELQQAMCRWVTYSRKHMEVSLDYGLLYQLLEDFNKSWGDIENPLSRDEEAAVADSFNMFLDYCLEVLQKHRELFPSANEQAQNKLVHLLKCLSLIHNLQAFKWCCPFRHELHVEVINSLKKGTGESFHTWYEQTTYEKKDVSLQNLLDLVHILNKDLQEGLLYYNQLFESIVGVNYAMVTYKQIEKLLSDDVAIRLQNEMAEKNFGNQVEQVCNQVSETNSLSRSTSNVLTMGTSMFELYMALQEFSRFRENLPLEERKHLSITNFYLWFSNSVRQWFQIAKIKSRQRIKKAVELDKVTFMDSYVKCSTSAIDVTTCFAQIKEFWRQLAWPDLAGSYQFALKIIEIVCDGAVYYANLSHNKLSDVKLTEEGKYEVSEELCITVNNIEHVLQAMQPLPEELGLDAILHAIEQNQGQSAAGKCHDIIWEILRNAEDEVITKIQTIIFGVIKKMLPEIKKFVFHLAWAPEKLDADSAISPLLEFLDEKLRTLYNNTLTANFDRILETLWTVVLHELTHTARSNTGKEKLAFFERLSASLVCLMEFFHANGKGLTLQTVHNAAYQELDHLLKLHKSDTTHLIELYCLQRIEDQQKLQKSDYGSLTIKAFYNAAAESLCIDVLNAKDLIPLDPTGFSDPFVIIELVPKHFFHDCPKQKTKVQKKTLFPLFDESFEFTLTTEMCRREGTAVCFTIMDHDMMTRNDYEGETYLSLACIPGVDGEPIKDVKPIELLLMHPDNKDEIILTLESRTWDKEAQEFVKQQRKHR